MNVKELMERKQGQHETFSDYVSDMHNLHFKLKHKIDENKFFELRKTCPALQSFPSDASPSAQVLARTRALICPRNRIGAQR